MSDDDSLADFIAYIGFGIGGSTLPYILDIDFLGLVLPESITKIIPGVDKIDHSKMGLVHWIFILAPVLLDREWFKIGEKFGVLSDPFEGTLKESGVYTDQYGNLRTDGGVRRRERSSNKSGGSGSFVKKLLLIGAPIVIVFFLLGSGYGDLAANQLGYQAAGINMPEVGATIAQAAKTVECVGNVACVRKWQFNNTKRPGSEEVGQEYSLQIENFDVNDGFPLDIANRRADDRVPADFSVYNPRHGLKGIDARNVVYRVGIYDNAGSFLDDPECQTDWIPLGGEYATNSVGDSGTILPGGFATPLGTHSELTLKNCGLLQPALGINRRVRLQLKYDYSSQSTLQVQAMSRQNMLSLERRPSFKKSQTADTPVKTYINVESPITYRVDEDDEGNGAESSVFGLRVGFETGQQDIKYRVDEDKDGFRLYDSSQTVDVETSDKIDANAISCEDLEPAESGLNQYKFSGDMTNYLKKRQEDSWFESNSGPSPARCSMVLQNPETISPTGETLTFRIDADYTVLLEEIVGGFKVENSQCTRFECPMLVPQSKKNESSNLLAKCESSTRLDANDGCGARYGESWSDTTKDYALEEDLDSKIEEGETAVKWENLLNAVKQEVMSVGSGFEYEGSGIDEDTVVGISLGDFKTVNTGVVGFRADRGDIEFEKVRYQICSSEDSLQSRYPDSTEYGDDLIFGSIYQADCKKRIEEKYAFDWAECSKDVYSEYLQTISGWNLVVEGNLAGGSPESCKSAAESIPKCESGIRGWNPDQGRPVCIGN